MQMQIYLPDTEDRAEFVMWSRRSGLKVLQERKNENPSGTIYDVTKGEGKRGRAASIDKGSILAMIDEGKSLGTVAKSVGCSRAYVQKVLKNREKEKEEPASNGIYDPTATEQEAAELLKRARREYKKQKERAIGLILDGGLNQSEANQIIIGAEAIGRIIGKEATKEIMEAVKREQKKRQEHKKLLSGEVEKGEKK